MLDLLAFCTKPETILYSDMQVILQEKEKNRSRILKHLKYRIDDYVIEQTDCMIEATRNASTPSAFPTIALTTIVIEILGSILARNGNRKGWKNYDYYFNTHMLKDEYEDIYYPKGIASVPESIYKMILQERKVPTKEELRAPYKELGGILYQYQRNQMMHSYYSRIVFLQNDEKYAISYWNEHPGILIEPYKYWDWVKLSYKELFDYMTDKEENNAIDYVDEVITAVESMDQHKI